VNDSFLDRHVLARRAGPLSDAENVEGIGCFGILRGIRDRSPSIELRRKTGTVLVVNYALIETMLYDPSEGIKLTMGSKCVRIRGRNLGAELRPNIPLITALASQRLAWIQEVGKTDLVAPDDPSPAVEAIEW
jgi:hypothetical protein